MRAAALVAARPQPGIVGEEQRDAALLDAIEDEERLVFGSLHDDLPGRLLDVDQAEPAAPVRRAGFAAGKAAGERMAFPDIGQPGEERLGDDLAGGRRRQHRRQRRVVEAAVVGIVGTGADQQCPAVADVARDVVEVEDRQHAVVRVAVEDDQVERVDLFREELAGGEGDQRQFVDRCAVLLLRRAQDGEVDEVDRGVGLEQVAPGALAGVRLAGDQQDPQVFADAFDFGYRAVVGEGQFAGERLGLELEDVRAGVRNVDDEFARLARGDHLGGQRVAVAGYGDADAAGIGDAIVEHAEMDRLVLSDDAEARRAVDDDAPVDLVVVAGEKHVEGRTAGQRLLAGRNIVNLPIGQHDHRADAVGRHVGKRRGERPEQGRAVDGRTAAGLDGADLQPLERRQALDQGGARGFGRLVAAVEALAGALVDDDADHGRQRLAVLAERNRVEERKEQHERGDRPHDRAAHPAVEAGEQEDQRGDARSDQQPDGQQRLEAERPVHGKATRHKRLLPPCGGDSFASDRGASR